MNELLVQIRVAPSQDLHVLGRELERCSLHGELFREAETITAIAQKAAQLQNVHNDNTEFNPLGTVLLSYGDKTLGIIVAEPYN